MIIEEADKKSWAPAPYRGLDIDSKKGIFLVVTGENRADGC